MPIPISDLSPNVIKAYQEELSKTASPATLKRKSASLNKFFDWASSEGYVPPASVPQGSPAMLVPENSTIITRPKKKISAKTWAMLGMTAGGAMLIFAAVWKIGSEIQFTSNRAANALITPRPLALNVTPRPKSTTTPTPSALPGQLIPADSALNPSPTPEALTTPAPLNESPLTGSISSLKLEGSAPTISGAEGNLLIEGKTLTLKTTDGGSGDITINPDGNGNLELLFEGDGQKFLSASAPNLTNGTLIYGNVANGATGYNLLQLQNGSSPITRFNVDAAGNVYASGNINTLSNIQINGVTRLNSLGRLTSITGYYQDSGLFAIDQGAADFAKISKVLTTSTGTSTADLLSLKLDESALTTGSNTNTLVLNRLGGTSDALALLVDSGNARFDGVIRLGQFSSDPVPLGGGSVYYNTTDKLPYFYNGTSWDGVATTSSVKWDLANGVVFPKNNSVDLTIGGSATASAKFAFKNVLAGTPTASISGTTSNVATFIDGNGNFSTTNRNNLTLGNSSAYNFTGNILLNPNGTGNVGIGATSPNFPLSFGTALGDKIALYDSGTGNNYGFGIQSALMQLYTIDSGSDITFGYGNSSTMTRNVTFTGAGKVGVGDISPTQTIDIVGTYGIGDVQVLSTGGGANSIYVGDGGVLASGADDNAGVGANALDSLTSGNRNAALGSDALTANSTGGSNTAVGYRALATNTAGSGDTALGIYSLASLNQALFGNNAALGRQSGGYLSTGLSNTFIGAYSGNGAGDALYTGSDYNTLVGGAAGFGITTNSDFNTILGYQAGYNVGAADGNVLIGYQAGYNETGDNKLYIANSNTASPLIWGDFSANTLNFNANVGIGTTSPASKLQIVDSTTTTGNVIYATASAITSGSIVKLGQGGDTSFNGNVVLADMDNTGGGSFTGNFLLFKAADSTKFTVDASGNTSSNGYYTAVANTNLRLRASGTGVGQTGTGSIYFQDSSGNTKGRFDTTQTGLNVGDGKDGAVSYSGATTINDNSQTYFGDQAVTTTSNSGQSVVSASTTTNLATGDEVLVVQMQGNGAGGYEFHKITSVSANTSITLDDNLTNTYTSDATSSAQIVEVPHFTNVTFSGTGSISPAAWNGTIGGILIFRANGVVNCTSAAAGCIFADGKGFRGGASSEAGSGTQGEGIGITQSNSSTKRWNGGGGGTRGATGGGGSGGAEYTAGANAAGGTGGRSLLPHDLSRWFLGGGGGGGGDDNDVAGVDGGAGGAGGGIVYIESQKIEVPSGKTITAAGSNGTAAPTNDGGGGGAGAGGFVWLRGDTIDLLDQTTTRYVSALGGSGGALHGSGAAGVAGGDGIARIDARAITGGAGESSTSTGLLIDYTANNVSNLGVLHVGKVDTEAADVAEVYQSEDNLEPGDIVQTAKIVTDTNIDKRFAIQKAVGIGTAMMGVISTKPGIVLGVSDIPNQYRTFPVALTGRTPVKVTNLGGNIHKGDGIALSSLPGIGQRASRPGQIVGTALEDFDPETSPVIPCPIAASGDDPQVVCGSIMTFIQPGWYNSQTEIATIDSVTQSVASASADFIKSTSSFAEMVAANIADGAAISKNAVVSNLLTAKDIVAESFTAFQGSVDNLLVKSGLVAPNIQTNLISPLADGTNIYIKLGSDATPSGKLAVVNNQGSEVASIDNSGNASFSGTLSASAIKSKSLDDITALLTQVETDQNLLKQTASWNTITATNSAMFDTLALQELYVTGRAAVTSLSVANTGTFGGDLILASTANGASYNNSINTLSSPLKLQSMAAAPIELMAGLVKIDTFGNLEVSGNLYVAGTVESSGLSLKAKTGGFGDILSIKDGLGTPQASVDASGSAKFNSVSTQNLVIAGAQDSTPSAEVNGIITTNSNIGSATIASGVSEIVIKNPKITDYSLIYVTPTSDTQNSVLYVKKKQPGEFTVGFNNPISADANFNWWIVQIQF